MHFEVNDLKFKKVQIRRFERSENSLTSDYDIYPKGNMRKSCQFAKTAEISSSLC